MESVRRGETSAYPAASRLRKGRSPNDDFVYDCAGVAPSMKIINSLMQRLGKPGKRRFSIRLQVFRPPPPLRGGIHETGCRSHFHASGIDEGGRTDLMAPA